MLYLWATVIQPILISTCVDLLFMAVPEYAVPSHENAEVNSARENKTVAFQCTIATSINSRSRV